MTALVPVIYGFLSGGDKVVESMLTLVCAEMEELRPRLN
jgi:hypothetical protein